MKQVRIILVFIFVLVTIFGFGIDIANAEKKFVGTDEWTIRREPGVITALAPGRGLEGNPKYLGGVPPMIETDKELIFWFNAKGELIDAVYYPCVTKGGGGGVYTDCPCRRFNEGGEERKQWFRELYRQFK